MFVDFLIDIVIYCIKDFFRNDMFLVLFVFFDNRIKYLDDFFDGLIFYDM